MEDFETKYKIDNKEEANYVEKWLHPKYSILLLAQVYINRITKVKSAIKSI